MALTRRRLIRLGIVSAMGAMLASCEKLPQSEAEVAQRVATHAEWTADVDRCPVDFMDSKMRVRSITEKSCTGEELPECFRRCERDDVNACYWLASTLQEKSLNDPAAQVLYQRACRLGEPSGCVNRAASAAYEKPGDTKTLRCSAHTYERACEFDDVWGCSMSGRVLWKGMGVAVDFERATKAFRKACAIPGSARHEACLSASRMLKLMSEPGAAAEPRPEATP